MELLEVIEKYKMNMIEADNLSKELYEGNSMEAWISILNHRAERVSEIFKEDNSFLDYVSTKQTFLDKDYTFKVYLALFHLYQENHEDPSLMIPLLVQLEEYYEKRNKYSHCIVLYSIHAYLAHEYIARSSIKTPLDVEIYKKILSFKDHYDEIDKGSQKIRAYIFISYFNLIVSTDGLSGITIEENYKYLLEMEEFYKSDKVQALDKDDEFITSTMEEARLNWLLIHERYNELNDEIKDALYVRSKEFMDFENPLNSDYAAYMAYYRCLYERGEISKEKLLDLGIHYLKAKENELLAEEDETERLVIIFEILNAILKWLALEGEANTKEIYSILSQYANSIAQLKLKRTTPYLNSLLSEWTVNSLPYLEDKSAMEQMIFDNLIRRQAPTYIHSVMVMKIAEIIYEYMDKSLLPELDNPLEYIKNSALLHDIGKSRIPDIINMQRRRLSDYEFNGIKSHPSFGAEILLKNPLLEEYYDVVLGHHKWYNGKGGYPNDFDNTKSKYRIIIDLITIADCLDAATDRFGRNYKNPKTVRDVLDEFERDKGIKYNPYFVDLVKNNEELIARLEILTQYKRPEYMYHAYIKERVGE